MRVTGVEVLKVSRSGKPSEVRICLDFLPQYFPTAAGGSAASPTNSNGNGSGSSSRSNGVDHMAGGGGGGGVQHVKHGVRGDWVLRWTSRRKSVGEALIYLANWYARTHARREEKRREE